jgi:hypothetical protein
MAHQPQPRRQLGGELVIPVLAVIFTLYYFSTILDSPWTAQVSAFSVGTLLLLFCALFIGKCVYRLRQGEGTLGMGNLFSRADLTSGRLGLFAATLGFVFLIEDLGFTLTTFLFLLISMAVLGRGRRLGLITLTSALMALGGWAVFIWAFDTRFPRGWFETTMKAVLANG